MSSVSVSTKSSQCLVSSARRYRYFTRMISSMSPMGGILLSRSQIPGRRTFQQLAVRREPRAVQRALPRLVGVVPVHDAAQVRTHRRDTAFDAVDATAALELPRRSADDAAFGWRAVERAGHRRDPTARQIQADLRVHLHGLRN